MKREYILGILFYGTLWGAVEAILGGVLYRARAPYASVPVTILGFCILAVARAHLARPGSSTLIGCCAMLYKFLNSPFFACHLLGIFLLGLSFDVVHSRARLKSRALSAAAAVYLGYALFALTITYVFRYSYWIQEGLPKVLRHIGVAGTMAALGSALLVPVVARAVETSKERPPGLSLSGTRFSAAGVPAVTLALWVLALAVSF